VEIKIDQTDLKEYIDLALEKLYQRLIKELSPVKEEKYYTAEQIALKLELHKQTVYDFITEGKLQAVTMGRLRRISQSSLDEFLKSRPDYIIKKKRKFRKGLSISNSK
jgi:excisionase family DNA binding protein